MNGNIYFLLLILFIFFIVIIITKLKTSGVKQIENFEETPSQLIPSNLYKEKDLKKFKEEELKNLPFITSIDVIKRNDDNNYPNKHILIKGLNLIDKVINVFFGPLKGIIIAEKKCDKEPNLDCLRVLPPDFKKYGELENCSTASPIPFGSD